MIQFIITLFIALFKRESKPAVATFAPEATAWYSERVTQEALRQLRDAVVVVLTIGLFMFASGNAQAQDIETPAGSCGSGTVILMWDRPMGVNPITIAGWNNPGSTHQPGERIIFDTMTPVVNVGDPYTISINGRTVTKSLPFSWECNASTPTPEPPAQPGVCRYYVKARDAMGQLVSVDIRLNGLLIGQTRTDDKYTWFNVECGAYNYLMVGAVPIFDAKLVGHFWGAYSQPTLLLCPIFDALPPAPMPIQ